MTDESPNLKLLNVIKEEAIQCILRGDDEDGIYLLFSLLDRKEEIKQNAKDPQYITNLIKQSNSTDEVEAVRALMVLQYLKSRGLMP